MSNTKTIKNKISKTKSEDLEINKNNEIDLDEDNEIDLDKIHGEVNRILYKVKEDVIFGELISFKISDVNAYITIKTKEKQIKCMFWKIAYERKFDEYLLLKEGDKIKLRGKLNILRKDLSIYFNVKDIEKEGEGNYMNIYYEYRKKINKLGWDNNKSEMPLFPLKIGIVTSLEGAAIQDILKTFENDNFKGKIIIKNAVVQGKSCADSVIDGINYFEKNNEYLDVLLITRGGGSFEDLVGFSDWKLLERVNNRKFVTISAVGHEIDNQLSDEVSDYKCATPSIGAKLIIERQKDCLNKINRYKEMLENITEKYKESKKLFKNVEKDYDKIVKKYELKDMTEKYNKYYKNYKKMIDEFNETKMKFIEKSTKMKPSLIREERELYLLSDFINIDTNKSIKPREIFIKFIDGIMKIKYTILEYDLFNKEDKN